MGIDTQTIRFLLRSKDAVSFESLLMLGRQMCIIPPHQLRKALRQSAFSLTDIHSVVSAVQGTNFYVEPLFKLLGAKVIESLDASGYEQATIVHDLNKPIPDNLKDRFSCVFDGGSLEHVFDFPQAIKNAMNMVTVGGHFLGVVPTNNFTGHGFYQFSPELYWRIFSEANGYEVEEMIVCEAHQNAPFYRVPDPYRTGWRVQFMNGRRTYLMIRARRLRQAVIFQEPPQQSDYVAIWSPNSVAHAPIARPLQQKFEGWVKRIMPEQIKYFLRPLVPKAMLPMLVRTLRSSGFEKI